MGYLTKDGLLYFVKGLANKFVAKESGKGLSTNDFTTEEKQKLAGIAASANNYVHPVHTARESDFYKVTVDAAGHVTSATKVTKADITNLGIPAQDTTYDAATIASNGLMTAADKNKLDAFSSASVYALKTDVVAKEAGKGLSTNDFTTEEKNKLAAFGAASTYALKADIAKAVEYKGSVATYAALPTNAETGDMYNVTADDCNYVWDGTAWDPMAGMFEVSAITNAEIDTILATV